MSIVQISKIQQRSGNLVDLPQLDVAEMGLATDAKRLFIGNDNTVDGVENVEVLTSYSNIAFGQITGSEGGLNISGAANGQVLAYDGANWVNRGGAGGGLLTLGDVANVKITGGSAGQYLQTNGSGVLSWAAGGGGGGGGTPGGSSTSVQYNDGGAFNGSANLTWTQISSVLAVTGTVNSNFLNVANTTSIANVLTLSIATGTAPMIVNSSTRVANLNVAYSNVSDYGKVTLQTTGTYYPVFASGSSSANYTFGANANLSFNAATGALSATLLTGTLTTAAQPNITSVGTLAGLVVSGHITPSANITYNLGNSTNRFNDIYLANSTIYLGAQTINANSSTVMFSGNVSAGNLTTSANVVTGGVKTDNYYYANGVAVPVGYNNSNVATYLPTYTGTVGATALTTGASGTAGTLTGTWSVASGSLLALSASSFGVTQASTDDSTKIATTAFVKGLVGNFKTVNVQITGGTTIPASYMGSLVYLSSSVNMSETTLPSMSVGDIGKTISFINSSSYSARVFPYSGQTMLDNNVDRAWLLLTPNEQGVLVWTGSVWEVLSGKGVGQSQSWTEFTIGTGVNQRIQGGTYYNTTGRPIMVAVDTTSAAMILLYVDGINPAAASINAEWIVPTGSSYSITISGGGSYRWAELR